ASRIPPDAVLLTRRGPGNGAPLTYPGRNTHLVARYVWSPSGPYTLPMPLALRPPHGAPISGTYRFTPNVPTRARRAMPRPRSGSSVHTLPASPYLESLAISTASASDSYGITATTGPQISSLAMAIPASASANTVGS